MRSKILILAIVAVVLIGIGSFAYDTYYYYSKENTETDTGRWCANCNTYHADTTTEEVWCETHKRFENRSSTDQ